MMCTSKDSHIACDWPLDLNVRQICLLQLNGDGPLGPNDKVLNIC